MPLLEFLISLFASTLLVTVSGLSTFPSTSAMFVAVFGSFAYNFEFFYYKSQPKF